MLQRPLIFEWSSTVLPIRHSWRILGDVQQKNKHSSVRQSPGMLRAPISHYSLCAWRCVFRYETQWNSPVIHRDTLNLCRGGPVLGPEINRDLQMFATQRAPSNPTESGSDWIRKSTSNVCVIRIFSPIILCKRMCNMDNFRVESLHISVWCGLRQLRLIS